MSFFGDRVTKLIDTVTEMRESYITMSTNFKNLENSYEKFVSLTDKKMEKLSLENEDIRRRLTTLEGTFDGVIKSSTKEALITIVRENMHNKNQSLASEDLKKLLDDQRDGTKLV